MCPVTPVKEVAETKVKAPLEAACHFSPVASALSATKPAIL